MERVDLVEVLRPIAVRDGASDAHLVFERDVPLEHLAAVAEWMVERHVPLDPAVSRDGAAAEPCWRVPSSALGLR